MAQSPYSVDFHPPAGGRIELSSQVADVDIDASVVGSVATKIRAIYAIPPHAAIPGSLAGERWTSANASPAGLGGGIIKWLYSITSVRLKPTWPTAIS